MRLTFDSVSDLARALRRTKPRPAPTSPARLDRATVPVTVAASRTEAELIVGMLRSNGLTADISADDAGGQEPELQLQGVRVLVAPSDEAPARRLIAAAGSIPPAPGQEPASPTPGGGPRRKRAGAHRHCG